MVEPTQVKYRKTVSTVVTNENLTWEADISDLGQAVLSDFSW